MPQLFDVIFDDLRSSKKNVDRLLTAGFLFVLIAHFYVIEPYFEYKDQERKLTALLSEKEAKLEQLSTQLKLFTDMSNSAQKTLKDTRKQIAYFPDHLREILPKIQQALSPGGRTFESFQQSSLPLQSQDRGISLPPEITTFEDGVQWYVKTWFNNLSDELQEGIVTPILQLNIKQEETGGSDLHDIAEQGVQNIHTYLKSVDPDFWRSYSYGKVPVARGLQDEVEKSFGLVEKKVAVLMRRTEKAIKEQDDDLKKQKNEMETLKKRMESLTSRLDSLESPLGRIPTDLPDLIKVFPLLIVALVVMVTGAFQKSNKLYAALWSEFEKNSKAADYKTFQQLADCWYLPPYPTIFQPLLLIGFAAINIFIFVRACLLVVTEPELFRSLTVENEAFRRNLFIGAYVIGALVISGSLWFTRRILINK